MTEVKRYRKLPVEIDAVELTQYGDFIRAVQWINNNGGNAVFAEASAANGHQDYLIISTIDGGLAEARQGWYVVRGVKGEFYPCAAEIFRATYEPVDAPTGPYDESLDGSGVYRPYNVPDGRTSLVGGATLTL